MVDGSWVAVAVAIGVVIFLAIRANRGAGPRGRRGAGDGSAAQAGIIGGAAVIGAAGWDGGKDPDPAPDSGGSVDGGSWGGGDGGGGDGGGSSS